MSFLSKKLHISVGRVILILILAAMVIAAVMVFSINPTDDPASIQSKSFAISGGLLSGLIVMIGQYLIELKNDDDLNQFRETSIKRVLVTRDDESFYRDLLSNSSIQIDVLGVTASRFIHDFADVTSPRPDKKVLLDAFEREVQVESYCTSARARGTSGRAQV